MESACCILSVIGALAVGCFVLHVLSELYKRILRPATNLKARFGSKGEAGWAVITGSSDGIGKEFALELARRGFNTLLISRTQQKLEEVAQEIRQKYKVKTEVLAINFGSTDPAIWEQIRGAVAKCQPVSILVNNVGINYPYPTKFLDSDKHNDDSIITVNIRGLNEMTRIVLPSMVERKRGAIINLSSYSGVVPAPMLSTYSASKAYISFFSQCLDTEYKSSGICVQCITPGLTVSNMSKMRKPSLMQGVASPKAVVKGSLDNLGKENLWSPYWFHGLFEYITMRLPRSFVASKLLGLGLSTRKRALAKEEREKQKSS